jgi:orotidine-5'-phosphate decarboxylase
MKSENEYCSAVKPNYAFFAQHGFEGLRALKKTIEKTKKMQIPVILDAKRGDIGPTSKAYAKETFWFYNADAITVSPFMGTDSVQPFIEETKNQPRGVYILNRTSNSGANDFQNLKCNKKPLYMKVSEKITEWSNNAPGNVGAVIGATSMKELKEIAQFYSKKKIPLLIPGVGAQGGNATEVTNALKKAKYDLEIVRINSSGALNYAYQKTGSTDFAGETIKALKKLNKENGFK